jgi:hypothetical protein
MEGRRGTQAAMASARFFEAGVECIAAALMLRGGLENAVRLNGILGLTGPTMFAVAATLGMVGMASQLSPRRLALVALGVGIVLLSTQVH